MAGGSVTVPDWPAAHHAARGGPARAARGDGRRVVLDERGLTVSAGDRLTGLDADLHDCGELTPVLAALAAVASTPSRLHRHRATCACTRPTASPRSPPSWAGWAPRSTCSPTASPCAPARCAARRSASYDDHRLAMAWAVVGLAVDGVRVEDVATTRKTVPDFVGSWERMLAGRAAR